MKAQVEYINSSTRMFAAKIEGYTDYVVVELLENCRVDKGDIVSHPEFKNMGKQIYSNETKASTMNVYVQDICTKNLVFSYYKMQ